ncbi:MAG: ABC transporter ATP-binding protein [Gammaproteobacteria bacterium]
MTVLVSANKVSKSYNGTRALDNVDLQIEQGRIVGLIGPNGAGKTTLLKAMLGLTHYEGNLKVLNLDPFRQRADLMKDVCFVADVAILPRWIKVHEVIDFVEAVHPKFSRAKANEFLKLTEIKPNKKVKQLSKGMVAQLHLALVMAIDVSLLVLDEPTLGLDILYRKSFYEKLLNDYFDEQRTIIVTTHQVEEIENIITDLVFIEHGRIVLDKTMEDVASQYVEVLARPERNGDLEALGPIHKREVFGKSLYLFENVSHDQLSQHGELHTPSVADLFVAKMKGAAA